MGMDFKDRRGRTITFKSNDGCVEAFHDGKRIGEFTLRVEEHDWPVGDLVHADVIDLKEEFRRAGIGREMVRQAFDHHGQQIIPPARYYPERENRNSMTRAGFALMQSCQREGWVSEFPDQEMPSES